jgi:SAM-dependent methyltransferase
MTHGAPREQLYDLLYSLRWGETTTNNYGFAPAETAVPERFQLQLYTELLNLLEPARRRPSRACARDQLRPRRGAPSPDAALPGAHQVIGLDVSLHAIRFCQARRAARWSPGFVRGHALQLPFADDSFDLVINVEASHAYRDDAALLREVRRVLRARDRFLYADHRTRRKLPRLERLICDAGLSGPLRDITPNVVRACELDSERRRALIRSGLPWWCRPLGTGRLERYAGIPGTRAFERLRSRDRIYFIACLAAKQDEPVALRPPHPARAGDAHSCHAASRRA